MAVSVLDHRRADNMRGITGISDGFYALDRAVHQFSRVFHSFPPRVITLRQQENLPGSALCAVALLLYYLPSSYRQT